VERLEGVRLLSGASQASALSGLGLAVEHGTQADSDAGFHASTLENPALSGAAWDAVLTQTELAELLAPAADGVSASSTTSDADLEAIESGLEQMNRYLSRAWYRAAIPAQLHDDCSQAVFTKLIQDLGRPRFEDMLGDIGTWGVKDVLSKETAEGVDFFRAVDMVKKRAQRERTYQSLEMAQAVAAPRDSDTTAARRDALHEAIDQSLNPREAALIQDTLMGKTPAEIAQKWGVAAKTVSNEKTRVLQKRDLLADQDQF
jgi:RNA polymerase sigma factor (sigma-70 family)